MSTVDVTFDIVPNARIVNFTEAGVSYVFPTGAGIPGTFTISNSDFTVTPDPTNQPATLDQSTNCHFVLEEGSPPTTTSTLGVQSFLSTLDRITFTVNNSHRYVAIYVSCGGDTGTLTIRLGPSGYSFGTVGSIPSGYTRSSSGSELEITSNTPLSPLYVLLDAGSGNDFNTAEIVFEWSNANLNLGPQALASDNSPPEACFGEDTMVETENGSERISSLKSGTLVKVKDSRGHDNLVKANILNRSSIVPTENRFKILKGTLAPNYPTEDLVISKDHLIVVPTGVRDSILVAKEKQFKGDCYDHERGETVAPFPVPDGFSAILVRNMKQEYLIHDSYPGTNWWHMTLPEDEYPNGGALVLSCGILAETHRTPTSILVKEQGWILK